MDKTVTITFSVVELQTVLAGIGKLPLEAGLELFNKIQMEAQKQLGPQPATEPVEK